MRARKIHLRLLPLTRSATWQYFLSPLTGSHSSTDADCQRFRCTLELGLQLGESHPRLQRPGLTPIHAVFGTVVPRKPATSPLVVEGFENTQAIVRPATSSDLGLDIIALAWLGFFAKCRINTKGHPTVFVPKTTIYVLYSN